MHQPPLRRNWILVLVLSVATLGLGAASDAAPRALLALAVILVAAKLAGELFERVGQPAVLGELLAGIALGNLPLQAIGAGAPGVLTADGTVTVLAEIGVVVLLFQVGLESDVTQMLRVGASSFLVATVGVVTPMALGWGVARAMLPDLTWHAHVFIGATLCATSVGITARVLKDLGKIQSTEGRIVLGAAVIDDVMGLVVLAVVAGIIAGDVRGQAPGIGGIVVIVVKATAFLAGAIVIGGRLSPIVFRVAARLQVSGLLLAIALAWAFALAYAAHAIGLAPIVGAFAAGLVLDEVAYQPLRERERHGLEDLVQPIGAFLTPVFFVVTGAHVDLGVLGDPQTVLFAGVLTLAAIAGKQVCSLAVLERGLNRVAVGVGMIPRGEVGLIFASVGAAMTLPGGARVVDDTTYGAVVVMVMATTLLTPPALAWTFRRA